MHTPTKKKFIENEIFWNNHLNTIGGKSNSFINNVGIMSKDPIGYS